MTDLRDHMTDLLVCEDNMTDLRDNMTDLRDHMTDLRVDIMTDLRSIQEAVSLLLRLMRISTKNTEMNAKLRRVF
jgi:hypothetical protein